MSSLHVAVPVTLHPVPSATPDLKAPSPEERQDPARSRRISRCHPDLAVRVAALGSLLVTGCARGTLGAAETTANGSALASGGTTSAAASAATGGASANGGGNTLAGVWAGAAPSCRGLGATCGPSDADDCCRSLFVPGGTYSRSYDGVDYRDPRFVATVSDFYLDQYEVTVGRLRAFVAAGLGTQASPPGEAAGAHPRIPGSGWSATWNRRLPVDTAALESALKCNAAYQTWTDAPGSNESKPANCLDWYTAFAFCAWDGARLATEAEWNYAASGGSEQRYFPWSRPPTSTTVDDSYAVYCGGTCSVQNVGSRSPRGDGRWGQSDLGGNAWEWTLDYAAGPHPMPCQDCAVVTAGTYRIFRGGSNDDVVGTLRAADRHVYAPEYRGVIGARCARSPL